MRGATKFLLAILCCPSLLFAQRKEPEILQYRTKIKELDGHAYRIETRVSSEDTTYKPTVQFGEGYTDYQHLIRWSSGAGVLEFVSKKGSFIVDSVQKKVRYTVYGSSGMSKELQEQMRAHSNAYLDSLFCSGMKVSKRETKDKITVYSCSYPQGHMLQGMELQLKQGAQSLKSYSCTYRSTLAPGLYDISLIQKVTLSQFRKGMPEPVKILLEASNDLEQYLKKAYPSFELIKSRA